MAIIDVIKFEGDPNSLAWKYPSDELRMGTQIIVHESQEAIFFKGGQIFDILGPGRHTLSTKNLPLLSKILKIPFGGNSPFKAEVWFINRAVILNVKWGTPTPIQLQDPKYGVMIPARAFGQFGVKVEDSKPFLIKLVGTLHSFDIDTLKEYFRGLYITKAKDSISQYVIKNEISVLHINAYLDEISEFVSEKISDKFAKYGLEIASFYINDISVPEDDPAVARLKAALARRAEMDIVGYSYEQERTFDTLQKAADRPSNMQSSFMDIGLGMGMGAGVGGAIGNQFGAMTNLFSRGNAQQESVKLGNQQSYQQYDQHSANQPQQNIGMIGVIPPQPQAQQPQPEQAAEYSQDSRGSFSRTRNNSINSEHEKTEDSSFKSIVGKPLNQAIRLLANMGFVDENAYDADEKPKSYLYEFEYFTDTNKPMFNPFNWTVESITLDSLNRKLVFQLIHKQKKGKANK